MARVILLPETSLDFDRIVRHLGAFEVPQPEQRIGEIIAGIEILSANPRIGRPVSAGQRELVIGQGAHGYVALYRYDELLDVVFVVAIRHQSEAGFREG